MNPITLLLSPWCWSWLLRHQRDIDIVKQRFLQTECSLQSQILSGVGRYSNLPHKRWGSNNNKMQQEQTSFITQFWHRKRRLQSLYHGTAEAFVSQAGRGKKCICFYLTGSWDTHLKQNCPFCFKKRLPASAISTVQVAFLQHRGWVVHHLPWLNAQEPHPFHSIRTFLFAPCFALPACC